MGAAEEPVHLAGATLGEHRHICERMLRYITGHAERRMHPMVILGGVLQVNLIFVPPDQYLHELRERLMAREAESSDLG
jgi:hypothetical protein